MLWKLLKLLDKRSVWRICKRRIRNSKNSGRVSTELTPAAVLTISTALLSAAFVCLLRQPTLALNWVQYLELNAVRVQCYFSSFYGLEWFIKMTEPQRNRWCSYDVVSGVARLSPPGADHKIAALFTPKICLQEFKMEEDHVACLFKDNRINKASQKSQSNTHKLKWILLFLLVATFLIITLPLISAFFTYADIDSECFVKIYFLLVLSFV